mgnify:CR=1 FL=1
MFNYLSILVGIFYIALGDFVMVYKFFLIPLEGITSYLLGGLLIIYGVFRIGRAIYYIRRKDEEDV